MPKKYLAPIVLLLNAPGLTERTSVTLSRNLVFGQKTRSKIHLVCWESFGGVLAVDDEAGNDEVVRDVSLEKYAVAASLLMR